MGEPQSIKASEQKTVSRAEAAKLLGISISGLNNAVGRGSLQRVGRGRFRLSAVLEYAANRDQDAQLGARMTNKRPGNSNRDIAGAPLTVDNADSAFLTFKARKERALAEKAELDLLERKGELMPREVHEEFVSTLARIVIGTMRGWPAYVGPQMAALKDANACVAQIKVEVERLIEQINDRLKAEYKSEKI